ncbi:transposase, partial [Roseovarius salinarum]|uniref:transposase n=1 Tax=Roseovarius salinarum TaxID=1981892 RepID=UPI001E2BDC04
MNKKSGTSKDAADKLVKGIKRKTRKQYSAEEKIRIVLAGLRGEDSIAALCRREGISESLYYTWSKEFLEAGKLNRPGFPRGFFVQNLRGFFKGVHLCVERLLHFLRR